MSLDFKYFPSKDEWTKNTQGFDIVPVWTELSSDMLTPISAYKLLVGDSEGFLLESAEHQGRSGRYSFIGLDTLGILKKDGPSVSFNCVSTEFSRKIHTKVGFLRALESILTSTKTPKFDSLPLLQNGLVGYIGYEIVREIERLDEVKDDVFMTPDAEMFLLGTLVAFDHWKSKIFVIRNNFVDVNSGDELDEIYEKATEYINNLVLKLLTPITLDLKTPDFDRKVEVNLENRSMAADDYIRAVDVAKEYITQGDIFQVVLSQRFNFKIDVSPFEIYRILRQVNPSPYLYYLSFSDLSVVGASPEPMVRLEGEKVISRPIAGTIRRGSNDEEDKLLGSRLKEDPKERAEHIMLVDLARNDVGRVCEFGTVKVDELMTLEYYSHVIHLTSQVSGTLKKDLNAVDVLRATLPAGTLSGAPKVRAMEIIDELEITRRGIYGGVVGYFDFFGNLDTAIAIRTLVALKDGRVQIQAGAGIVADSDGEKENQECIDKAGALLKALSALR